MALLHIEDLSFRYPNAAQNALNHISLDIEEGEFLVLCGETGCGKSTFLKLLKRELAPAGEKSGKIEYDGKPQESLSDRESACIAGYVFQNPDNQIVTDKVWHELAFGLENLGFPTQTIRRRVGEMASYFGIQNLFRQKTDELSGGQKQLLNLASVMVMQPRLLILDEPTGQLDPIAAAEFITTLQKLNRELGLTILLAEHRLEEVFPIADRILLMEKGGNLLLCDTPRNTGRRLMSLAPDHPMLSGFPSAVRIFQMTHAENEAKCPLTVREGRDYLKAYLQNKKIPSAPFRESKDRETEAKGRPAIELKDVWFRYGKELPDVLRGVTTKIMQGEIYCILGGNGTGKTTALNVVAGLNKAYRGNVLIDGKAIRDYKNNSLYRKKLAMLPQNPQTVFVKDTVKEDLAEILKAMEMPKEKREEKITQMAQKLAIEPLLGKHPYDLSGGEQQKCALAKVLLTEPTILLLDEPTKGLDAFSKQNLRKILQELKADGLTVAIVTHDVEFAAANADRCALFFDGEILSADTPTAFFSENNFYTTAASRIARSFFPQAVTCEQVGTELSKAEETL